MLGSRTVLNGGKRGQKPAGYLVRSTFLVLTFALTLAFMDAFVLTLVRTFFASFGGGIFTLLGRDGEKGRILLRERGISFGAFGWTLACAQSGLIRRVAFHWSLEASIYREGRGSRRGQSRPVSGIRGEVGGVAPKGAGANGALVIVLEAPGCGRRANGSCLGRFILRHAVAAESSSLSFSASRAVRRATNWWMVSSLQKYRVSMDGIAIWRLPGSSRSLRS